LETTHGKPVVLVVVVGGVSVGTIEVEVASIRQRVASTAPKVAVATLIVETSRSIGVARVETQETKHTQRHSELLN